MVRSMLRHLVIAVTLAATSTLVYAANKTKKAQSANAYSAEPLDREVSQLPPNYRGHDVVVLHQKINVPAAKGEYEKTEEYEARVARWGKAPILGSITPSDTFAFEVSQTLAPINISMTYDADKEQLASTIKFKSEHFASGNARWLDIAFSSKELGSHIGITGMGVKFRVTSHSASRIGLVIAEPIENVSMTTSIPRDDASKIKPQLVVFAIAALAPPYKFTEQTAVTASLSSPSEWLIRYSGLNVDLKAFWLVNRLTGEIVAKNEGPFPLCSYKVCF